MRIMFLAVCANFTFGTASVNAAVAIDDVVVPDGTIAFLLVPSSNILYCVVTSFRCVGTMDDDFIDSAHCRPPFHAFAPVSSGVIFSVIRT